MFKWIEGHVDTGYTRSDVLQVNSVNRPIRSYRVSLSHWIPEGKHTKNQTCSVHHQGVLKGMMEQLDFNGLV